MCNIDLAESKTDPPDPKDFWVYLLLLAGLVFCFLILISRPL